MPEPLLILENIGFSYVPESPVLLGLNLELYPGEILGVLGENGAGKTTLGRILAGELLPTAGIVTPRSPGVFPGALVPQHPRFIPEFTLRENLLLGREGPPLWAPYRSHTRDKDLLAAASALGFSLDLDRRASELSSSQLQKAALTGALLGAPRILILDEPTASLPPAEGEALLSQLKAQTRDGTRSLVLVTHRLEEAFRVCDRIMVLRDGKPAAILEPRDFQVPLVTKLMVDTPESLPRPPQTPVEPVVKMDVRNLGLKMKGRALLEGLTFSLQAGEILGLAGIREEGLDALEDVLSGLKSWTDGEVVLQGRPLPPGNPREARSRGLGYVPWDRLGRGSVPQASLLENLIAHQVEALASGGLLRSQAITPFFEKTRTLLDFEGQANQPLAELSGGNIQRLILSRELESAPEVLLLSEPSWGLDLAGRRLLHDILRSLRNQGRAILLLSSDLGELLDLSDRLGVVHRGRLTALKSTQDWTAKDLDRDVLGAPA